MASSDSKDTTLQRLRRPPIEWWAVRDVMEGRRLPRSTAYGQLCALVAQGLVERKQVANAWVYRATS